MNSAGSADKAALRRQLRASRKALPPRARAVAATRAAIRAIRLPEVRLARHIAVYLAVGSELDTGPLIAALRRRHVQLSVPVVEPRETGRMRMCALPRCRIVRTNRHGIAEPTRGWRVRTPIDLVLLPLLGFDARGHRLGSGSGYYDRWLARQAPRAYRLGYAYQMQECTRLPADSWDQPMDAVCTEIHHRRFTTRRGIPAWRTG